jgi:hypothetical protein
LLADYYYNAQNNILIFSKICCLSLLLEAVTYS